MNKYSSPKAELVEFSIQSVILASEPPCTLDLDGCSVVDGTGEGQTLNTQSLV